MDPGDLKVSGHLPSIDTWTPTKQQVMSFVAEHYRNKRYYDQSVPSNIAISRLSPDPVYACTLETLVEERAYGKGLQPHDGSPIEPQSLPALWDTKVDVPGGYEDKSFTFRMRGTEVVRTCPTCKGNRHIICTGCRGAGRLRCGACGGSGKNCTCDGGYYNCQICNGLREVECPACRGYGQHVTFQELQSKFSVIREQSANKRVDFIRTADQVVFETTGRSLTAEDLSSLPDEAKALAVRLILRAPSLPCSPSEEADRIQHKQRLTVSLRRNVLVDYHIKGRKGKSEVRGIEQQLVDVPVRYDYRKITRDGAFLLAAIAMLVLGVYAYQLRRWENQYLRARTLLDRGDAQAARVILSGLAEKQYKDSTTLVKRATFELARRNVEQRSYGPAMTALQELSAEEWPGSEELLLRAEYGNELYQGERALSKGDYQLALAHYEKARSLIDTPEVADAVFSTRKRQRNAALTKYQEGNQFMRKGNYDAAYAAYSAALRIDPNMKQAKTARRRADQKNIVQVRINRADQKNMVQARINLAAVLQAGMQAEGRKISVSATGNNYETLEFSSGLIFDGSNTFRAVERETTLCAECLKIYKILGFKQIVIRGSVRKYHQVIRLR